MNVEMLSLLLFGSFLVLAALGLPLTFCLGGLAFIFLITAWEPPYYQAIFWDAQAMLGDFFLLPIPLFTFMACMLERSGIAEDLYIMMHRWIGRLAGGLAIGTVVISTLLAAMIGLSAAATVSMGIAALPHMLTRGYDKKMSMGAIAAGGTLGILIPPSVIMVVYSQLTGVSPRGLFMGGFIPGLLLASLFIIYIAIRCRLHPNLGPPVPVEERANWREKFASLRAIILPGFLVILVLGSISMGIVTVSESAAVGAAGSILCVALARKLNWKNFKEANYETLKLTGMIMWIIIAAMSFTRAYVVLGAYQYLEETFMALPFGRWGIFILIQIAFFILGCFLDPFGILMLAVPLFATIIQSLGFDLVWFGIIFVVNMEMAYLTPPVGLNLFYMKAVAPKGTTMGEVYRAIVPFVLLQGLCLILLTLFPQIVLWLPNVLYGSQ